jgi:hypothetical protein
MTAEIDWDEEEFTRKETERQDQVDGMIMEVILRCAPYDAEIDWDIGLIGVVRDAIQEVLVDELKIMTEQEFYPYRDLEPEPSEEPDNTEMIITDEEMVTTLMEVVKGMDADDLAKLAGDFIGGLCWYTNDGLYSFTPDENYCGGLDWTKDNYNVNE